MIYSEHVFVLAASNLPWDLDPALLRRLEKRILVPMPGKEARKEMLKSYLLRYNCLIEERDFEEVATLTEGYSGADMKLLCKEAGMRPVRRILKNIEELESNDKHARSIKKVNTKLLMKKYPITVDDLRKSIISTKASTNPELLNTYKSWSEKYGAT
jgi:katanin p60 ATPase-containing subunit A1